jgi:hypothetical protein
LLDGGREDVCVDVEVSPIETSVPVAHELVQDVQALIEHGTTNARIHLISEGTEVRFRRLTQPGSEDDAPMTEVVQRQHVLRHNPRTAPRKRRHQSPDARPFRRLSNGAEQDPRIVHVRR